MDNFNHTESQPYYNTNFLSDEEWKLANEKATGLQKIIDAIFDLNPELKITGWLLKRFLEQKTGRKININSTRRCLSNLKNEMKLFKTGITRIGEEGQPECYYSRIAPKNGQSNEYLNNTPTTGDLATNLIKSTTNRQMVFFEKDE